MGELEEKTIGWFLRCQHLPVNQQLWQYFLVSKKGRFEEIYTRLIVRQWDHKTVHLISSLPALSNRLTPKIAKIVSVSRFKMQLLINMIIYWLILYYSGKSKEIPSDNEGQKLIGEML
ncbi:hypothetical protein [uncultured Cedecea sp.]|uniref:hypothetical protein n=1 Tax=uncultured Cedecea sp. TaxID=988762 RepID=UPI002612CE42|nr:hypothetical protein [uncultured Cedecea sp.]